MDWAVNEVSLKAMNFVEACPVFFSQQDDYYWHKEGTSSYKSA